MHGTSVPFCWSIELILTKGGQWSVGSFKQLLPFIHPEIKGTNIDGLASLVFPDSLTQTWQKSSQVVP
jgi:hypothetical protein